MECNSFEGSVKNSEVLLEENVGSSDCSSDSFEKIVKSKIQKSPIEKRYESYCNEIFAHCEDTSDVIKDLLLQREQNLNKNQLFGVTKQQTTPRRRKTGK